MTRSGPPGRALPLGLLISTLLFCGAMFGFFFAWTSSTLWGLDRAAPEIAIAAMQAMNAAVGNPVFGAAFFGTPLLLVLTTAVVFRRGDRLAAVLMVLATLVYIGGALIVTVRVNVPLNEALATLVPGDGASAASQWRAYSAPWQRANLIRTCASGAALVLVAIAAMHRSIAGERMRIPRRAPRAGSGSATDAGRPKRS